MLVGTGYLTKEAFDEWENKPISTVIETLHISEVTFPKIVVCPPKEIFNFTHKSVYVYGSILVC